MTYIHIHRLAEATGWWEETVDCTQQLVVSDDVILVLRTTLLQSTYGVTLQVSSSVFRFEGFCTGKKLRQMLWSCKKMEQKKISESVGLPILLLLHAKTFQYAEEIIRCHCTTQKLSSVVLLTLWWMQLKKFKTKIAKFQPRYHTLYVRENRGN